MDTITLSGKAYPFRKTPKGIAFCQQLHVNEKAVANGNIKQLKRYAYCIAAGAAHEDKKSFNFTNEDAFIKACPHDWRKRVNALLNADNKKEVKTGNTKK